MRNVTFSGANDDLVEVDDELSKLTDEYEYEDRTWQCVLTDSANGDTAVVYVEYRNNGCWTATVGRYEEDYSIPESWNAHIVNKEGCEYSSALVLSLPDSVELTVVS